MVVVAGASQAPSHSSVSNGPPHTNSGISADWRHDTSSQSKLSLLSTHQNGAAVVVVVVLVVVVVVVVVVGSPVVVVG